ncbi:MAG: polymer-forming cytoskeletal protein [Bacteroidia bacterium]|nr:polymer-forming cytoskeletal protein [Bacteroidia bacterium]
MEKENIHPHNPNNFPDNTAILNSGKGYFSFKGNLRITGIFSGNLIVSGTLTLGVDSRLTGEVVVDDLIVFGQMIGTARVSNLTVFHNSSAFSGTLSTKVAEVYEGSSISGERIIGRLIEKDSPKTYKNSKFNIEAPLSIPDEMAQPFSPL